MTSTSVRAFPSLQGLFEGNSSPLVYTMTELNQHTARVLDEINAAGRPAAITKHGKFMVMITPLVDAQVESTALTHGPVAEEFLRHGADADAADWEQSLLDEDEVRARLDRRT